MSRELARALTAAREATIDAAVTLAKKTQDWLAGNGPLMAAGRDGRFACFARYCDVAMRYAPLTAVWSCV
jgi:hypothetical protein